MMTIKIQDIDTILNDYGIGRGCASFTELQRYDYAETEPAGKYVRLIIKAETEDGGRFVIRFKNEEDVTLEIAEAQSRFAAALREHGIETPKVYASFGQYARWYLIGGYDVIITVEEFTEGELSEVGAAVAEKTGRLLARMHNISEAADLHVENEVLFDPLKRNDLFGYDAFARHREFLVSVDEALYETIESEHARLVQRLRTFKTEPRYAVQGDISDCNLYVTADGDIGVFDFNRSGDNVLYFDAVMQAIFEARLMDYPAELAENPEPVILPAFLRGYNSARPFTDGQREAFPYLYALVSAFWLGDLKWNECSLEKAVAAGDRQAAHDWMKKIHARAILRKPIPV